MALFELKNIENHSQIGVWKIEESIEELENALSESVLNNKAYKFFKSDRRKREWLATRVLLHEICNDKHLEISYDDNKKPVLPNGHHISISHSKLFVAVMLSKNGSVGVDIQVPKNNIDKGISIFMTPIELAEVGETNYSQKLHIYWCAKEALYKYVGDNTLNIYSHFKINPVDISSTGLFTGVINTTREVVNLKFEISELFYLIYTI